MKNTVDGNYCSVPDCYNTRIEDSAFCIVHQEEISFEIERVTVWRGDELVGEINMASTPSSFEMKMNDMPIGQMKKIVDAVYARTARFSHTKYHSNWEEE